jgi:hypothetical protein
MPKNRVEEYARQWGGPSEQRVLDTASAWGWKPVAPRDMSICGDALQAHSDPRQEARQIASEVEFVIIPSFERMMGALKPPSANSWLSGSSAFRSAP